MTTLLRRDPGRVPGEPHAPMRLLANQLTAARLAAIPLLWILALTGRPALVGAGIVVAALTDVLDGLVARRTHTATRFGSGLDSLADHLLTASVVLLILLLKPAFVREQALPLALWAGFGITVLAVGWARRRRIGDLHLYTAKAASLCGYAFVVTLFFAPGYSRAFFGAALGLAVLGAVETLLVLLLRARPDEHAGSLLLRRRDR